MVGQRTLPNLGLVAFWTPDSNGWDGGMDLNLLTLSCIVQGHVISSTTSLPGSPTNGDIYIIPVGDSDEDLIAIRDDGEWVLVAPQEGWRLHVDDRDIYMRFDGLEWVDDITQGRTVSGTTDTAVISDAGNIIKGQNVSAQTMTIPAEASVDFPMWTVLTYINAGAGLITIDPDTGVTLNPPPGYTLVSAGQHAVISVIKTGSDEWTVTGHLEASV